MPTPAGAPASKPASTPLTLRAKLRGAPLRHRLVAIIVVLLGVGLLVSGAMTALLLRAFLTSQVDDQIRTAAASLSTPGALQRLVAGAGDVTMPSDYYVHVELNGTQAERVLPHTTQDYGTPILDVPPAEELDTATEPVTVSSDRAGVAWRARTFPVLDPRVDGPVGSVTVALPLKRVDDTVAQMMWLATVTGLSLVILGAMAAWLAVRTALRPLRQIEATAEKITGGDLSQRVPPQPSSTEVGRVALALNAMLAQIERSFAQQTASEARMRRFIADASHELRTPLATVRGYGELYRMGGIGTEDLPNAMSRIESEATRMGALVADLLQLARMDEGRQTAREPVDLRPLALDAISDLRARDPHRLTAALPLTGASASMGDEAEPLTVLGDEAALRQVLTNLLSNVDQHTPHGTPVEVALGREGDVVVLEVRDHGPGIAQEDAERIFERFYRLDDSRARASGGSGLGLAIVAAIVAAHGGTVRALSTPGGGATMRVELPALVD